MSDSAEKETPQPSPPSSSSAEERGEYSEVEQNCRGCMGPCGCCDSRVPTGGEPEQEHKDHGAALLPADPSAAVQTEPLPITDGNGGYIGPDCGFAMYGPPAICTCGQCKYPASDREDNDEDGALW